MNYNHYIKDDEKWYQDESFVLPKDLLREFLDLCEFMKRSPDRALRYAISDYIEKKRKELQYERDC